MKSADNGMKLTDTYHYEYSKRKRISSPVCATVANEKAQSCEYLRIRLFS